MIGTSSYVTSMKKGRAIGGCLCSGSSSSGGEGGPFLPLAGGTMSPIGGADIFNLLSIPNVRMRTL